MKKHLLQLLEKAKQYKKRFLEGDTKMKIILRKCLYGIATLFILFVLYILVIIIPTLPDINNIQNLVAAQSSVILDRNGEALYSIHGDENRKSVPLNQISPNSAKATLAIEDDRFYEHIGIDVAAIFKAVCSELHICSTPRGGSTITQQFVKNAFLSPERTYTRKLKEIILALEIEAKYTKDEILGMYLNRIPYGSNIFGVEVASQTFFGKPAVDLTIAESAILAAIPKAPTYYSPYGGNKYVTINLSEEEILGMGITSEDELVNKNPDFISKGLLGKTYVFGGVKEEVSGDENTGANDENSGEEETVQPEVQIYVKGRVDFVLNRMVELGYITQAEADTALNEANAIEFKPFRENITAPHFVMYVKETLEAKYGKDQVEKGGLKVTTTIDLKLQQAADKAVADHVEHNAEALGTTNASLVAMNPNTGEIMAMVGSRDFWNDEIDGKVNIAMRPRLPGSSFKPIVYAAAFLQGYAPSSVVYDVRTKFGGWYAPENYDGKVRGPITMRSALASSLNIPAVKTAFLAGIPNVLDLARKMGLQLNQPDDWYGLSLALGAGEVRLLDHVAAYSVFANGGYKTEPVAILKVEDKNGNILEQYEPPKKHDLILDPQVAYLINDVLSDNAARPDAYWQGQLSIPGQIAAAKTGTSNKKINNVNYPFDVWTMGYVRDLVAGVWAGNANGDHLALKADGLGTASPIWKDFMIEATKEMPKANFEKPEGIKYVKISKRSGKLPSESTPAEDVATGIFASFATPREYDNSYEKVEIDKVSGKLATEYTPPEAREEKSYFRHHSEFPDDPNWENPVRAWAKENNQDEEPPTEYDDVHTAGTMDTKPQITIIYPSANSKISPPYIGVWVDITSPEGVSKVDYYWDDELVNTSDTPPFKGNIEIPDSAENGSEHTIKAIAFDELYRSSQASVEVKIGADDMSPEVSFVYPSGGAEFTASDSISVEVDARDPNGDILKVDFYLDDELVGTARIAPYILQITVPGVGTHKLKAIAYDHAKNETTEIISIDSVESENDMTGDSRITQPASNASFDAGESVLVKIYLSEADKRNFKSLSLLAKKESGDTIEITSTETPAETYNFIWSAPTSGRYELSFKLELEGDRKYFSRRIPVVIR